MAQGTVALVGSFSVENLALDLLVAEFGWSFKQAPTLRRLAELNVGDNLVTVLFSPQNLALPWDQALRAILDSAPRALPILCHRFADAIDWPQVAEAGAFHSLLLPFDVHEIRQSLGFVSAAKVRQADVPIDKSAPLRKVIREHALDGFARLNRNGGVRSRDRSTR